MKLHSPNTDVKTISLPKWNINTKNSYMKYNNDREDRKDRLLLAQILPTWANDEFSMSTWNKGWLKWVQSSCIKIMIIIYILPPKSWLEDFDLHGTNNYCPLAIVKKHPSMQKLMPMLSCILFCTIKPTCLHAQWYTNQSQEHTSAIALIRAKAIVTSV